MAQTKMEMSVLWCWTKTVDVHEETTGILLAGKTERSHHFCCAEFAFARKNTQDNSTIPQVF